MIKKVKSKISSFLRDKKKIKQIEEYSSFFENKVHTFCVMEPIFKFGTKVFAGENCGFFRNVTFRGGGYVRFGDRCSIGDNTIIFSCGQKPTGGIYFGNNVLVAANCSFYDNDHSFKKDININQQALKLSPIIVEDDVWFGTGCIVLRGSIIRKGAVIGAGSVVKGEIPENAVAVGVPAKVIKYRE